MNCNKTISLAEGRLFLCHFFIPVSFLVIGCQPSAPSPPTNQVRRTVDRPLSGSEFDALLEFGEEAGDSPAAQMPTFRNLSESLKLTFQRFSDEVPGRFFLPEVMGGGVAWIDIDRDGQIDLYAVNGSSLWTDESEPPDGHTNHLFRNVGGSFVKVTQETDTGDPRFGQGCAVGDFNADGFDDLYIANYGRNTLLQSNGDGTFENVTDPSQTGTSGWSSSCVWFDANGDGLNDLYVVNYLNVTRENHRSCQYVDIEGYCGPGGWNGVDDILYLNDGNGTFHSQTSGTWSLPTESAKGLSVAVADFDEDRIPEVYVANDMMPNFLLKRLHNVSAEDDHSPLYQNMAGVAGCAVSNEGMNEASMGIACSDFDGDGLVDVFLTHFFESKNTLYRNLGELLFEDASRQSRIAASSFDKLGFGTVSFDANLNGSEDIFIANGHVLGPHHSPNAMSPQLLLNDGTGLFRDVSASSGPYFLGKYLGRGVAGGDYNNDGLIDLAVSHVDAPLALLHNETAAKGNYLGLNLVSENRCYPVGAQIIISNDTWQRTVPVVAGGSYLSANDQRIVIGVAEQIGPFDVRIRWNSQVETTYSGLKANQYWIVSESGHAAPSTMPSTNPTAE